jgi:ABC-2 type transport system permease protein
MKKILTITWNDIKIEFSNRWTLFFFIALPIIFTAIVGVALGGSSGDTSTVPLPVVDLDGSEYSRDLQATLTSGRLIEVLPYTSEEEALSAMDSKSYTAALVIPAGFRDALTGGQAPAVRLIERASDTILSVEQAVRSAVRQLGFAITIADRTASTANGLSAFSSPQERQQFFTSVLQAARQGLASPSVQLEMTVGTARTKTIANGFSQSSPGQLVTWVMITMLTGSTVFVEERIGGTLRRLLITPSRKATIIAGKILGRLLLGLTQMVLLVGFGALVLKVNWGSNYPALAVMLVSFALAGTALGVMLGAFARTPGQAGTLSVMFSMILAALGGAWWPLEITPAAYQATVRVLPTTWAMSGLTDVIVRGKGVVDILPAAGILLGFALVFFVIGIWRLRYE